MHSQAAFVRHESPLTGNVIGAAIEVHSGRAARGGAPRDEECLAAELEWRKIAFERQVPVPIEYRGKRLHVDLRIDLLIARQLVVELKAVESLLPIHEAQLLTYLKLSNLNLGLLLNFNVPVMRDGIVRIVHKLKE